jgi:hypothetical protein
MEVTDEIPIKPFLEKAIICELISSGYETEGYKVTIPVNEKGDDGLQFFKEMIQHYREDPRKKEIISLVYCGSNPSRERWGFRYKD